jgi:hypothetical protein
MHAEHKLILNVFNSVRDAPDVVYVVHLRGSRGECMHCARPCKKCRRMLLRSGTRVAVCSVNGCTADAPHEIIKL